MALGSRIIYLDCIIFGLQQHGGISNYWAHVLDSFKGSNDWDCHAVLPQKIRVREYQPSWLAASARLVEAMPPGISRYLVSPIDREDSVFHTSYYRLPSKMTKRYVVTAYDFMYERYRSGPPKWVHSWQKRRSFERADVVACISSFTRDQLIEFCPNVDPLKLRVIPLGVDTNTFYPDRQSADSSLQSTVLFVGTRNSYKRFDLAIKAVRALPHLNLGVVGPALSTEEHETLNSLLSGRWREFGPISSDRLRQLYSSVYALILPSDCEGFGLPVLEAMACGCPVITAHRGSLPEVGGKAALYAMQQSYEEYSAAIEALDVTERRVEVISAGQLQVKQFTWAKTIQMTHELYS